MNKLPSHLHILADENIAGLEVFFQDINAFKKSGDTIFHGLTMQTKNGRSIEPADLVGVHLLLVRSVTEVNQQLLSQADDLLFIGTTTIGTNHIDVDYLAKQNIQFAYAPACNAQGVCEYVIAAISLLRQSVFTQSQQVGLIGYGSTGSRIYHVLEQLDIPVCVYDPFKQVALTDQASDINFVSYEQAIHSDIVSFHVPLTHEGDYPTFRMLNIKHLPHLKHDALLINTSRGDVIEKVLLNNITRHFPNIDLALDVWPDEPRLDLDLVKACAIATPHIAGYSWEGKWRGSLQIYQAFIQAFALDMQKSTRDFPCIKQHSCLSGLTTWQQVFFTAYPINKDDQLLRDALLSKMNSSLSVASRFDQLRKNYQQRCEWTSTILSAVNEDDQALLLQLGFQLADPKLHDQNSSK